MPSFRPPAYRQPIKRREFLKSAVAGAAGLTILSRQSGQAAPSDRITVAHIGLGSMGRNHLNWFSDFRDVEVAALCDVDQLRLAEGLTTLRQKRPGNRAQGYGDFRRVLERQDIDVITCATPDHWHAPIARMAFQAGKDVYGEKPLSFCPAEGKAMLADLERYERVFQLGTQIHAGENYHRVVELLRSGKLGEIHTVRLWKTGGPPKLGFPADCPPPPHLDWEMWLGPAPLVDYNPAKCHGTFRYFLDFSGGVWYDFWCHIADIAFWALEPKGLRRIEARGETPRDSMADTPEWIEIGFEFENLTLYWSTTPPDVPGTAGKHIGAYFEGSKGTMVCDYHTREIRLDGQVLEDLPEVPRTIPRSPGHQRNFLDCVKSRRQPMSNLAYARQLCLPSQLGLIAWRLGRPLAWDSTAERFVGDPAADYLLDRPYRAPWTI